MPTHEHELIPYAAAALRGERLLVLAPHPDDEVIGCGGLVALHVRERRRVEVVVVTDGAAGRGVDDDPSEYVARRKDESRGGLAVLGAPAPRFLDFPDRGLDAEEADLAGELRRVLLDFEPDLVLAPSPIEIHPDHRALARTLWRALSEDEGLIRASRVAFYETSQPIRPNAIVDITDVAALKLEAIRAHRTQQESRDYEAFARGLSEYRALTMPAGVRNAEAYRVFTIDELRTRSWSGVTREVDAALPVERSRETLPITVITRTKNRPDLLRQAIASIRASTHPARIVVVNDGGTPVRDALGQIDDIRLVEHELSHGRSAALNAGVDAAETEWIAFLDDDDLYEPEHLEVLARAAAAGDQRATYTDAVSIFLVPDDEGGWRERDRLRIFAQDFDPDLLVLDNYIPLPTLLVRRQEILDAGGFDPSFDLFEDWDFLLRLARRGELRRIPRVTCSIRHFEGSDSAVLAAPEGSLRFREAKLRIWQKHADLLTETTIANAWERQKRLLLDWHRQSVEDSGRARHLEGDLSRLEREKAELIEQLGAVHQTASAEVNRIGGCLAEVEELLVRAIAVSETRRVTIDEMRHAIDEKDQTLSAVFAEIERLNGLLETIYRSKTWKMHVLLEKARGH